jgi:hypothetical protein
MAPRLGSRTGVSGGNFDGGGLGQWARAVGLGGGLDQGSRAVVWR